MKFIRDIFLDLQFKRVLNKSGNLNQISFRNTIEQIQKMCIVYPHDKQIEHDADNCLKPILDYFPNTDLTIIKPNELHKVDLRFSRLPKKKYFMKFNHSFDLIIDLNLKQDRFSSYIVANLVSKLKVRIYADSETDTFYQLSIASSKDNLKEQIETLLEYFSRFKKSLI
jgi:hypothetical protein